MKNIAILGAGTWGAALGGMLARQGHAVTVWSATGHNLAVLERERRHPHLEGVTLPREIVFTDDLALACQGRDVLVFAVGSVYIRETAARVRAVVTGRPLLVNVAKGLEKDSYFTMTEVIAEELGRREELRPLPLVALSGPTHAEEVARELPTTIVAASESRDAAKLAQKIFSAPFMRVYTNGDIRGVELCGALKNIIALSTGISTGLGYGDNSRAALITRGMAEIARLGAAWGCHERTFYGLAGMGDLIVTATSMHSRNNRCGILIGQGCSPREAVEKVGMVVEGINALPAALEIAGKYGVDVPLITAVDAIVNRGADPRETVLTLMNRQLRSEFRE